LVLRDVSASIALNLILPDKDTRHYAALTDPVVVGGLMRAIDGFTGSFVTTCALKLSALTFVRPGELRHAEWAEIDLDGATWNIPGSKMKMKLDHLVPLSTQTTILNFRHLLQTHRLSARLFDEVNGLLAEKGLLLREDTTVDATLIAAPPSTKNREGKRDEEMHQTKKGQQWYFGMKAHIGVDAQSGLVHTVIGTAANVSDVTQAQALLHGDETAVFGDAGYQGVEKREENLECPVTWHIALRPGKRKALRDTPQGNLVEWIEHTKASIRAKVEHPFHVVKNLFRHRKTRYRGLAKNTAQLFSLFGFANLVLARRALLSADTRGAS
jgi:IS5 family transposase